MNRFLSIQEAVKLTGKSQSTITRLARKYKGSEHVKMEGKKTLININEIPELVNDYSTTSQKTSQMTNETNSLIEAKNETIELLKTQLEVKDKTIESLIERNREANILIRNLQEQISLPEATIINEPKENDITVQEVQKKPKKASNTPEIMRLYRQGLSYQEIADIINKKGARNQYGKKYKASAIKTTIHRNK